LIFDACWQLAFVDSVGDVDRPLDQVLTNLRFDQDEFGRAASKQPPPPTSRSLPA